jgi:hypothetical protein
VAERELPRFGDRIAKQLGRILVGIERGEQKKAARTVICPCREASDATCTENRAVRATTSTTTELILAEACSKLLAENTKFRKKMHFQTF